jgi:hypothetical protein
MVWMLIALGCASLRPLLWRRSLQRCMRAQKWQPSTCLPGLTSTEETRSTIARASHNSLTPISLNICGLRHPTRGYVQLQWYVPSATPLARTSTYVMSPRTSLAPSIHQKAVMSTSSILECSNTSRRILLHSHSSGGRGHRAVVTFRFFPSTPHVFRLRHNRTGNNVADIRLFRPPSSGAA